LIAFGVRIDPAPHFSFQSDKTALFCHWDIPSIYFFDLLIGCQESQYAIYNFFKEQRKLEVFKAACISLEDDDLLIVTLLILKFFPEFVEIEIVLFSVLRDKLLQFILLTHM
jgi:hypothetical protein